VTSSGDAGAGTRDRLAPRRQRPAAVTFAPDERAAIRFVLALATALHRYGTPANRLEEAIGVVARHLGLTAEIFATPTTMILSFGEADMLRTRMLRVDSGELDMGKLAAIDALTNEVIARRVSPDDGLARIEALDAAPPTYNRALGLAASPVTAASMAVFFGGSWLDAVGAAGVGLLLGLLGLVMQRSSNQARVYEVAGATLASLVATLLASSLAVRPTVVMLAALVVLLPGMSLTTAMTELATRNLISGTARLMSAVIVLLKLVIGVAFGQRLAHAITTTALPPEPPLPAWTAWLALAVSTVAITVVVQAVPRAFGWIAAACVAGYGGAQLGTQWLGGPHDPVGAQLGVVVGAFALAVLANVYARVLDRPAQVVLVPATFVLVPGSMGFRGMTSLLDRNTVTGVDTMFAMFLTAMAIVAGMLIANATLSPRRVL
jgi:uncharacterized membrane protein YjjP (DUF1212 family)